jgi:primary-amine oxidase
MGSLAPELPHPFDPLSLAEIETAITIVKKSHGEVFFNVVSLHEPRKAEMTAWLAAPDSAPRPKRIADIVVIAPGGKVYDGLVDIAAPKIIQWELMDGVQPIVSSRTTARNLSERRRQN